MPPNIFRISPIPLNTIGACTLIDINSNNSIILIGLLRTNCRDRPWARGTSRAPTPQLSDPIFFGNLMVPA